MSDIKCDFRVFAIDETANWDESITAITGRIAGVYIADFAEVTHICSLRGSIWAEFICNITERELIDPDGYCGGKPFWDSSLAADYPELVERSKALVAAWKGDYHGIQYEGASEGDRYLDEGFSPVKSSPIDMAAGGWDDWDGLETDEQREQYRDERRKAAMEAAQDYMSNGETWSDLAPWNS